MDILDTYTTTEKEKYTEEDYKNMLDDCTESIEFMGVRLIPSVFLETHDPIAFRCGFSDYQEYEEIFECIKCDEEHETEEEAAECCHVECLECNEWHETEEEAENCCEEED